jgi:hypothetical protein
VRKESVKIIVLCLFFFIPVFCYSFDIDPYQRSDKPCLNIVFSPVNYEQKSLFFNDLDRIFARLKKTLPFNEFADKINFYRIDISKEEEDKFFQQTGDFPPLRVHEDLLQNIENSVKSAYKLVIIDAKGADSCAQLSELSKDSLIIIGRSRYIGPDSFTKGFLHELGHSLGLRDECLDCSTACEPGFPNCAATQEEAQKYWGDLVAKDDSVRFIAGCCGRREYIRGTIASVMNNAEKAESFGPVNERYLRQELTKKLLEKVN